MVMAAATYPPLCEPSRTATALRLLIDYDIYFLLYVTVIYFVANTKSCLSLEYYCINLVASPSYTDATCISAHPDDVTVIPRYSTTDKLKLACGDASVSLFRHRLCDSCTIIFNTGCIVY